MKKNSVCILITSLVYVVLSIALILLIIRSGNYPMGDSTMYYIYRADEVYRNIQNGNWFIYYDMSMYNGVELLKYFGVLPAYFMAFVQWLSGGNAVNGYLVTTGIVYFLSAEVIFYCGLQYGRRVLSAILGGLWFFFPLNTYLYFQCGELPAAISILIFIPFLYFCLTRYLQTGNKKAICFLIYGTALLMLNEEVTAVMFIILSCVYVCFSAFFRNTHKRGNIALLSLFIGCGVSAFYGFPALFGNIHYLQTTEGLIYYFQSLTVSLNPFHSSGSFYIGISLLILSISGLVLDKRANKAGYAITILIILFTSVSCYRWIRYFLYASWFRMNYMCAICASFLVINLLAWITLRKFISFLFTVLLAMDCIPSLITISMIAGGLSDQERFTQEEEYTFIQQARQISKNHIALMDDGELSSLGSYLVSVNGEHDAVFGSGWTSSGTKENTRNLIVALKEGNYLYMFDRLLSYGADAVIIKTSLLSSDDMQEIMYLNDCAEKVGYSCINKNGDYRLYYYDCDYSFGVQSKFENLAIGTDSSAICMSFPSFDQADDTVLDHYTFEELKQYTYIYLSGFTYDSQEAAEELLKKLADSGVRIVITADGIPEDKKTHHQNFLGLECQPVQFKYGYPELDTINGLINADLFPLEYKDWKTVYVNGLKDVYGSLRLNDKKLDFYGTVYNENIVIIGLRMTQFYGLTKDSSIYKLLQYSMQVDTSSLPERTVIPVNIHVDKNVIEVTTEYENVETSIAYAPCMHIQQEYIVHRNLLVIKDRILTINLGLNLQQIAGLIVSALSILCSYLLCRKQKGEI